MSSRLLRRTTAYYDALVIPIRSAYASWPTYNRRLREVVGVMTDEQLALRPGPDRWPIWATVGHVACQRVFWLCDFAGERGADSTPFTNAAYQCPGDEDLETVLGPAELVEALDTTFRIVERCLDSWSIENLGETIRRDDFGEGWVHTRGWVVQRVFAHDVWHCGQLAQTLGIAGLPKLDVWT